jgi:acetyltransferase-like isoleucine patch superfamily enzyme
MKIRSLNNLRQLRAWITAVRRLWLSRIHGVKIHPSASISLSSRMLPTRGQNIVVGEESLVAFKTLLITRTADGATSGDVRIGRRCFIGGGSTLMPGVTVGDESIIGAGSVVFDNVPPQSIVGGNPARVLRTGIEVGRFGRLSGADDNSRRLWRAD